MRAASDKLPAETEALQWAIEHFNERSTVLHGSSRASRERHAKAMRLRIAEKIERGEVLLCLEKFLAARFLREADRPHRGPAQGDKGSRDLAIAEAMIKIVDVWGFSATRNEYSAHACAASIVREALIASANIHLSEAAIKKIWRWEKMLPFGPPSRKSGARGKR
jgi:hypothetical protein